jgi:hypothetical protein
MHWKVIPRNTSVVAQNTFSITPKTLDAFNMVLGSMIHKLLGVIDHQMLTKALQRFITSKGIRKVNRVLAGMVLDISHEGLRRDRHPTGALQQAKNDAFTQSASASLPLTSTAKIGLIHLNLAQELGALEFYSMKKHHPESLVHPGNSLGIQAQIASQSIARLLLIKALPTWQSCRAA